MEGLDLPFSERVIQITDTELIDVFHATNRELK
jgi:hypothetical protein